MTHMFTLDPDLPSALTGIQVECPWCAESFDAFIEPGIEDQQSYYEDCRVCCQPIRFELRRLSDQSLLLDLLRDDE